MVHKLRIGPSQGHKIYLMGGEMIEWLGQKKKQVPKFVLVFFFHGLVRLFKTKSFVFGLVRFVKVSHVDTSF